MHWNPFDPLFWQGKPWAFHGGIYKPEAEVPKPTSWFTGGGYTNAEKTPTVQEIMEAIEKFKALKPEPALWGKPVTLEATFKAEMPKWSCGDPVAFKDHGVYAKGHGVYAMKLAMEALGPATVCPYDITRLPENPRVSLHPHPCAISQARALEITGGIVA